ncbi:hypothetical protein F5887DRAFT_1159646 [Amanita rubescens]|nr:hypothetical protein F5887DRAFT_1159646 [Amanita rubescens]
MWEVTSVLLNKPRLGSTSEVLSFKRVVTRFLANRYLRKENFQARIRSCDYEGVHSFIVITHRKTTEGSVGSGGQVIKFEEEDQARRIKAEMGLQEVEFVTVTIWIG